jgi:hypothetical protein
VSQVPSGEIDPPVPDHTHAYIEAEYEAHGMLFAHVRYDVFSSPKVTRRMTDLTCKLPLFRQSLRFENLKEHTKNHIHWKLESEKNYS